MSRTPRPSSLTSVELRLCAVEAASACGRRADRALALAVGCAQRAQAWRAKQARALDIAADLSGEPTDYGPLVDEAARIYAEAVDDEERDRGR